MPPPVALQLPIELWRIILFEAAATPVLPYKDSNRASLQVGLVECIDLFDNSCKTYYEYRTNQATLTNLRLVCRTWATLLQDFRGLCFLTDLKNIARPSRSREYLSRAERVHIDEMAILGCKCSGKKAPLESTCMLLQNSPQDKKPQYTLIKEYFMSRVVHSRVRILSISVGSLGSEEPLALTPNLLALSLHMSLNFVWGAALSKNIRSVTHLALSAVTPEVIEKFPPSMTFDCIRYLSLNLLLIPAQWSTKEPSRSIGEWKFPNLHSLVLKGTVNEIFLEGNYVGRIREQALKP
ncbi:hypothetical protein CPB86DRAFT_813773 [Serendipita vermifera]|nr:hypothetical protein CPB86DRAFT_813773 [Serendipita vermifera]